MDARGLHRAACPRSGRLKLRSGPMERMLARVCREAGARIRTNVLLRDMNVAVQARDERRIEILAHGLPCFGGAQLAVDATLRCALSTSGAPRPRSVREDGAALMDARADKERAYPELAQSQRCRLIVLGLETGGRWSDETAAVVWELARAKSREAPGYLRHSSMIAWHKRWTSMISVATFTAFAYSLLMPHAPLAAHAAVDGEAPLDLVDLFGCVGRGAPGVSRLPLRG